MIKKLRIKFICVVMLIVTIMIGGILGGVMHFSSRFMEMQSINMMQNIASAPIRPGVVGEQAQGLRLPFFIVQTDHRGRVINASGGYYDLSDSEYLQKIVDAAFYEKSDIGKLSDYGLRYCKVTSAMGQSLVFSDLSTEQTILRNLFYSCLAIGLLAWLVFAGISILLSHWVIKPAEKAWTQQRQFVADASHELKTPLSVIMANAELLQSEDYSPEEKNTFAKSILSMTYQMRSLVANMLEMAKVDNCTLKMQFASLDFSQLVTDAALSFQLLYEEQGRCLRSEISEGIHLRGSESHLFQVMDVLLDNALKYSSYDGPVIVTLKKQGGHCLLRVANPGAPLSKEELKKIFKRFYRGDKARAMNGSYGLGLSIADSVVATHKGKIWAESRDGYNIFCVQLPTV